jgi:hypothetical protein
VNPTTRYEKYLGLPALIGRSRSNSFAAVKGKIWDRMNGWKEKFLSQAGKEILLKAVVQAIPIYTMSVFLLPKVFCKELNAMMARFWWGHKEKDSRIAWMSWKKMGMAKERGGLGFRDFEMFNYALLAKQGWRLFQQPDSLAATIMKEKYYPRGNFLDANLGRRLSYTWRSLWNAKPHLKEGLVWQVGNGSSIRIWGDKWISKTTAHTANSLVQVLNQEARVSELLDHDSNWWNIELVQNVFFFAEEANEICGMVVCPRSRVDRLV